jgi:hypothetical protein
MECPNPKCDAVDRVTHGWVTTDEDGKFFEQLVCNACQHDFLGDELPADDPTVQGHLARKEEERLRELRLVRYRASGSDFDMSDPIALVDGHGKCIAIIDGDPRSLVRLSHWFPHGVFNFGPRPLNMPELLYPEAETFDEAWDAHYKAWLEGLLDSYK